MKHDKTIRCKTIRTSESEDTSLGNRFHIWAQGYYLSDITDFDYKIIVELENWPELFFLDMPHTYPLPSRRFLRVDDTDMTKLPEVMSEHLIALVIMAGYKNLLMAKNHWYMGKWYIFENHFNGIPIPSFKVDPFTRIKFRLDELNDFFDKKFGDFVGIHIRRFQGMNINNINPNNIPKHLVESYMEDVKKTVAFSDKPIDAVNKSIYYHPFIPDELYYQAIDKVLEKNPDQKIYLSTDLPLKYYQYYKEKYKNIFDRHDFYDEYIKIMKIEYGQYVIEKFAHVILELFDLFALSRTKLIFQSAQSSWGRTAQRMRDTKKIVLSVDDLNSDKVEEILSETVG